MLTEAELAEFEQLATETYQEEYVGASAAALPRLVAEVRRLRALLYQARRPVAQWVQEYSRDPAAELAEMERGFATLGVVSPQWGAITESGLRLAAEVRACHELLEWLGHMIGVADWWASPDARACVPCDGCRIEAQEMADALAPWRERFVAKLNGEPPTA
jgi:hypothetical protein